MSYRLDSQEAGGFEEEVEVVPHGHHEDVINEIENKVNEALKLLEPIQGLDVIDQCKEILSKLSSDLY